MPRPAIVKKTEHAGEVQISYRIATGQIIATMQMPIREAYEVSDILNGIVSHAGVSDRSISRAYWIARSLNPAWKSHIYQEPPRRNPLLESK